MNVIKTSIIVDAPIDYVFDCERNITVHQETQKDRNEKAISGVTQGLINLNQEVEWKATHFGFNQKLRVKITKMDKPNLFVDELVKGIFKDYKHEHYFKSLHDKCTKKSDIIYFQSPFSFIGNIFDTLILKKYLLNFLNTKNSQFKTIVEKNYKNSV